MPNLTSTQTRSANDAPLYVPMDGRGNAQIAGSVIVGGSATVLGPTDLRGNVSIGAQGLLPPAVNLSLRNGTVAAAGFVSGTVASPLPAVLPAGVVTTQVRAVDVVGGTPTAPAPASFPIGAIVGDASSLDPNNLVVAKGNLSVNGSATASRFTNSSPSVVEKPRVVIDFSNAGLIPDFVITPADVASLSNFKMLALDISWDATVGSDGILYSIVATRATTTTPSEIGAGTLCNVIPNNAFGSGGSAGWYYLREGTYATVSSFMLGIDVARWPSTGLRIALGAYGTGTFGVGLTVRGIL